MAGEYNPLEASIRRRQSIRAAAGYVTWSGLAAYERDLAEGLEVAMRRDPAFEPPLVLRVQKAAQLAGAELWTGLPLEAQLYLNAGVLVTSSALGVVGFVHGGPLPDKDIKWLGIGMHRFWLLHSAVGAWALREFLDLYQEFAEGHEGREASVKLLGAIGSGAALGIGLHLVKDGAFGLIDGEKSVVFAVPGVPGLRVNTLVKGTFVDDNVWLMGNALWAFKISHDIGVLAFGKDLATAKAWVDAKFQQPLHEPEQESHQEGDEDV